MYCKNCGHQLDINSRFCTKCGQQTQNEGINTPPDLMAAPQQPIQQQPINHNYSNQPYQEPSNLTPNVSNTQFQNPINNNYNENQNANKNFMNWLPLILGISALISGFINEYIGILLGVIAIVISAKINSSHSKKGKIMGIIATTFFTLYIIGTVGLELLGFTVSDKNLNGPWNCTSINSLENGHYNNTMDFNNGEYIFNLNGTRTSDKYRIKPSTYNKDVWESLKSTMKTYFDITDDKPETFMLDTNNTGDITIIKINTTNGEIIFVYTNDTYVCQRG